MRNEYFNGIKIPYDKSISELENIIRNKQEEKWAAFFALANDGKPESLSSLINFANSDDPFIRRAAIEAIGDHRLGNQADIVIEKILSDSHGFIQRTALDVIKKLQIYRLHDKVIGYLSAHDEGTRKYAIICLESIWTNQDYVKVFELFIKDKSYNVHKEAAEVLFNKVEAKDWQELFKLFTKEKLPRHRKMACELAYRFSASTKEILETLEMLKKDRDGHVRKAADRALIKYSS